MRERVLVVGAGIIGICCALELARAGFRVTVTDPEPPGRMTSFGNAGGIGVTEVVPLATPGTLRRVPGWLLDPLGPLSIRWRHLPRILPWLWRFHRASTPARIERAARALAALLRPTYDDLKPLLRDAGIADILVERGALTVYGSNAARQRDDWEWEIKRAHGVRFEPVDATQLRALEPALSPELKCGVLAPDWSHVRDPYRVVVEFARLFEREGGTIVRHRVEGFSFDRNRPAKAHSGAIEPLGFDQLVVAAGPWSKPLAASLGSRVPLESERGYNTTLLAPGVEVSREVIFAERKFVITPLSMGLRIGGAAEFAGLDAPPDYRRSKALLRLAQQYVPGLHTHQGEEWMGHRPTLPDSLPVIGRSPHHANVLYAFGHQHLGLTQAPTTARLIGALARGETPSIDLGPFRIDRF